MGDKDRIEQVIINLISNATKYSPSGTEIFVETISTDSEITVSVQDHGIGIADTEHKKYLVGFIGRKTAIASSQDLG